MNIKTKVQEVFNDVFERDDLILKDDTTANDVEGWDSLTHIHFILELEKKFGVKFALGELQDLQNIGDAYNLIESKTIE